MKRIIIVGDNRSSKRLCRDLRVAAKALKGLEASSLSLGQLKAPRLTSNLVKASGENHLVWFKPPETSLCELESVQSLFTKLYVVPVDASIEFVDHLFDELTRL